MGSWEHLIAIEEAIEPGTTESFYPRLIADARPGSPEDIGGFPVTRSFLRRSPTPTMESTRNPWNGMAAPTIQTTSTNHGVDGG